MTNDNDIYDFLEHHGVKGMRWGVRKDQTSSETSSTSKQQSSSIKKSNKGQDTEDYKKILADRPKPTVKEAQDNFVANVKKSEAKTNPSGEETKDQNFDYEKAAKIAVGAAVTGVILYAAYQRYSDKGTLLPKPKDVFTPEPGHIWNGELYNGPNLLAGKPVSTDLFGEATTVSKKLIWKGNECLTDASWNQQEFSIPADHTFKRISKAAETTFGNATYATASQGDYDRYLSVFRAETKGRQFHEISFTSKKEIKVPDLTTRLNTVKEALGMDQNDALTWYSQKSGSDWSDDNSKKFFSKLIEKGYDAIIDDMDSGVIGEAPLVIVNSSSFTEKVSRRITNGDLRKAASTLTEISNRRP